MVTDHHNWLRDRAGGGSPAGARAGQAGRPGRGRRRAAVAIMAAGAAALGAMLAVPAGSGAGGRGLATDTAHRIGSLFINIGGPSEQVDVFPEEVYPQVRAVLRARYDIVTFDPRGFSHSTPIRCFSSEAAEAAFFAGTPFIFAGTPAFPVGAAQQAAFERTFARF